MRTQARWVVAIIIVLFLSANAQVPKETKLGIYDFTKTLAQTQVDSLNQIVWSYEKETTIEIAGAIITAEQFNYYGTIFQAAQQIYKSWGVGKKELRNGLLIVFCPEVKPKQFRIHPGSWTSIYINAGMAGEIIDSCAVAYVKQKDYYQAYRATILRCIQVLNARGGAEIQQIAADWRAKQAQGSTQKSTSGNSGIIIVLFLVVGGVIIYVWVRNRAFKNPQTEDPEIRLPPMVYPGSGSNTRRRSPPRFEPPPRQKEESESFPSIFPTETETERETKEDEPEHDDEGSKDDDSGPTFGGDTEAPGDGAERSIE